MENKNVLILYHSGAGSTKTIAEFYYNQLIDYNSKLVPISDSIDNKYISSFNFLILAFPTYHCEPSYSMLKFIEGLNIFTNPIKTFISTTYGLYSGNAIRILAKVCSKKNIQVVGYSDYRAPATDGSLLFPPISFMFKYEKNIAQNIKQDIFSIKKLIEAEHCRQKIPYLKLYTILNFPNKYFGKMQKPKIKIGKLDCSRCKKCIKICPNNCWYIENSYPQFNNANCESCYRCIHHCTSNALILSNGTKRKKKLNSKFYIRLQNEILSELNK